VVHDSMQYDLIQCQGHKPVPYAANFLYLMLIAMYSCFITCHWMFAETNFCWCLYIYSLRACIHIVLTTTVQANMT